MNLDQDIGARLDEAVKRIVEIAKPELVVLFGSYAEGRASEASDVDLLVVAETDARVHLAVALDEAVRPILAPLNFDILVRTPQRWELGRRTPGFISREADRKGVRLYEAV